MGRAGFCICICNNNNNLKILDPLTGVKYDKQPVSLCRILLKTWTCIVDKMIHILKNEVLSKSWITSPFRRNKIKIYTIQTFLIDTVDEVDLSQKSSVHPPPPTTHINLTKLFLSSLLSDLSMWGHFLIVLNLKNPKLMPVQMK